jgi:hypothetical protein
MPVDVEKLKAMAPPAGLPFGFRRTLQDPTLRKART